MNNWYLQTAPAVGIDLKGFSSVDKTFFEDASLKMYEQTTYWLCHSKHILSKNVEYLIPFQPNNWSRHHIESKVRGRPLASRLIGSIFMKLFMKYGFYTLQSG